MKQKAFAPGTNLKTYGSQYYFIHLAVHGTFDMDKPLNSALLLARDKGNEALRQAQLKVKKQYQHPYYWAAFVLTGNAI